MNLLKKTFGFLVVLSLLLGLFSMPAFTYADGDGESDEPVCSEETPDACPTCENENGKLPCCDDSHFYDQVTKELAATSDNSYIVTEIYEPLSSIDEKITNGTTPISEVKAKYQCRTHITYEWMIQNDGSLDISEHYHANEVTTFQYASYEEGCPEGADACSYVQLIVSTSGTGLLKTYIAIIYRWAAGLVGIVAILVIVISGIQISIDQGGGENVTAAKNRIMQSIAGLVILFLSGLILYTINPTFFTK